MACRRDGIIPAGVDLMDVHKEATAVRATSEGARCRSEPHQRLPLPASRLVASKATRERLPRLPEGSRCATRLRWPGRGF
jgi:hypothetical protein